MCNVHDVLVASEGSASKVTTTFFDYGEGSLGEGIRRFAGEMLAYGACKGYEQGVNDTTSIVYNRGVGEGWANGYSNGCRDGLLKGSFITFGTILVISLSAFGVCKIVERVKKLKVQESTESNK